MICPDTYYTLPVKIQCSLKGSVNPASSLLVVLARVSRKIVKINLIAGVILAAYSLRRNFVHSSIFKLHWALLLAAVLIVSYDNKLYDFQTCRRGGAPSSQSAGDPSAPANTSSNAGKTTKSKADKPKKKVNMFRSRKYEFGKTFK